MMGEGLFQITLYHGYLLQILAAELIFNRPLPRRSRFWLRLPVGAAVYAALAVVIPNFIARYVSGFFSLTIFLLSLGLCLFCFRARLREVLFCCVGAQLTQNLAYNVENLIYQPFAAFFSQIGWLCLSLAVTAVVYGACWWFFARQTERCGEIRLPGQYVYAISLASALFVYTMQFLFQSYGIDNLWIIRPPLILCCIAGLCLQYGLLALRNAREENQLLERFMRKEQKQYEITRNSMDLINMKAHDLKHQITLMKATGRCDGAELAEIESAIAQYASSSNTGCKPLDAILTEKQLLCRTCGIEAAVMAQGESLAFLQPADIASLFGNLLDNAIEYERAVEPASRRCISLNVAEKNGFVYIRVENYCPTRPEMYNGLPVTSKADKTRHGFGLRSVQYITEKYGGTMHIGAEGDLFVVSLLIPVPRVPAN